MDAARLGPFDYVLTADDLRSVKARARRRWRASGPRLTLWPTVFAMMALLGLWFWLAMSGAVSPGASQWALMFGVAGFFAGKWLYHWEIERAYARTDAQWSARELTADREISVAIDDSIVAYGGRTYKAEVGWDHFVAIEETAGLVWLWMSNFQSVVVAARAFPDPDARAAFVAFARARIKPAKA